MKKIIAFLFLALTVTSVSAGSVFMRWHNSTTGEIKEGIFDLRDPATRMEFLTMFSGKMAKVEECADRANYAIDIMKERDAGVTEEQHLNVMRENYENTFDDPEGPVPRYMYVDFNRMVRDLHRRHYDGYTYTDSNVVWAREFRFCFLSDILPY